MANRTERISHVSNGDGEHVPPIPSSPSSSSTAIAPRSVVPPTSITPPTPVSAHGRSNQDHTSAHGYDQHEVDLGQEHDVILQQPQPHDRTPPFSPPPSMLSPRQQQIHRGNSDEDALGLDVDPDTNGHGSSPRSVSSATARQQRREQRQASPEDPEGSNSERRESLVSNDSTGRGSTHRAHQRKMMMAQQMSLGIDGEYMSSLHQCAP